MAKLNETPQFRLLIFFQGAPHSEDRQKWRPAQGRDLSKFKPKLPEVDIQDFDIWILQCKYFFAMQIYARWLLELHQHLQLLQRHQLVSNLTCRENSRKFSELKITF